MINLSWGDMSNKALRIADNRISDLGETDWDVLKLEFDELSDSFFDMDLVGLKDEDFPGFKDTEIDTKDADLAEEVDSLYSHQVECPSCGHKFKKTKEK